MNVTWFAAIVSILLLFGGAALAEAEAPAELEPLLEAPKTSGSAAITLVGRGNRAAEVSNDGTVTELTRDQMVFVNRSGMMNWFSPPLTQPEPDLVSTEPENVEQVRQDDQADQRLAVEEALKASDREAIEDMRRSRQMWFFDEKGKVMPNEELERRLATGNFSGIRAVNDYHESWTPSSGQTTTD